MLSLFYEGRISCFQPVTYLDRTGITLIRPLLYTPEYYVRSFAARHALPIVHNPCPADGNTKRQEIKDLLSYLKVLDNAEDDLAVQRIINIPKGESEQRVLGKRRNGRISMVSVSLTHCWRQR